VVTTLGVLAVVAFLAALGLLSGLGRTASRDGLRTALAGHERHPIAWAWVVSLIASMGSLYFSEIAHFIPCSLCWYQRIAMYPMVVVLGIGAIRGDTGVWRYGLPLAVLGAIISVYHLIIQWMPMLDVGACTGGVPCTGRYVAAFRVISIPTMAAAAFLLIIALLFLVRTLESRPATEIR
jgi:disulfide bond formation protein DsbB